MKLYTNLTPYFVGKTRKVMKLLHWERGGYVMYYKRLETGWLSPRLFPSDLHIGFREIRWDELVLFIEGISPNARRRKCFQASENKGENYAENKKITMEPYKQMAIKSMIILRDRRM